MGAYLGSLVVILIIFVNNFRHFVGLFLTFDDGPEFAGGSHVGGFVTTGRVKAGLSALTGQMAATLFWAATKTRLVDKWFLSLRLSLVGLPWHLGCFRCCHSGLAMAGILGGGGGPAALAAGAG